MLIKKNHKYRKIKRQHIYKTTESERTEIQKIERKMNKDRRHSHTQTGSKSCRKTPDSETENESRQMAFRYIDRRSAVQKDTRQRDRKKSERDKTQRKRTRQKV